MLHSGVRRYNVQGENLHLHATQKLTTRVESIKKGGGGGSVTDLETICIQHTDVPKVSYVVKYVCSQIPFLLSSGRIKGMRCDFF